MKKYFFSPPFKVSLLYLIIAGLWIITSDRFVDNLNTQSDIQTYKGWFFVIVTSLLLFIIINKLFNRVLKHNEELLKAQKELHNNKALLDYILNNIPQSIFWKDTNSTYLGCNKVFAENAGLKNPEEIIGKTDYDLPWTEEDADAYIKNDKEVIKHKQIKKNIEEPLQTSDGNKLIVNTTKIPLFDRNKKIIGVLGVFDDITNNKLKEETLIESENRYRMLFESNPQPMWVFDTASFKFLAVNDAAIAKYGFSREEFLSLTIKDIRPDEDINNLTNYVSTRDEKIIDSGVWRHKLKNGQIIFVEIYSHKIDFENKKARLVLANDITHRKIAEEKLIESENRFKNAIINAPFPILIYAEDGEVLNVSKTLTDITGYKAEEISTLEKWTERAYGEFKDVVLNQLKKLNSLEGMKHQGELEITCADGGKRIWDFSVSSLGRFPDGRKIFIRMASDVTERKLAEETLKNSEIRHRSTLENMQEGYQIIGYDWKYIYVNESVCRQANKTKEELIGFTMMEKFPGIEKTDMFAVLKRCMKERIPEIMENEFYFEDENKGWFQLSIQPVPEGIFILSLDITERKKAEEKILNLNAELEQRVKERTQQLEDINKELEAFTYSVSHDLRSPLRAIDGFSKIILEDYESILDEEGKRLFSIIRNNTIHMDNLITDLLSLSRVTRGELKLTMADMFKMVSEIFKETLNKNEIQKYEVKIGKLPDICCDASLMRQVWSNLISNAVKYTSPKETRSIEVSYITNNHHITYYIKDNGVGFNPDYSHKLFGVFQRLHSSSEFEGTGVGLAIVERIINKHGGKVWGEGKINGGAVFYFSLPKKENCNE